MKLTTPRTLRRLALYSVAFALILGSTFAPAIVSAQVEKMPDISGVWLVGQNGQQGTVVIGRVEKVAADFVLAIPNQAGHRATWSQDTRQFKTTVDDPDDGTYTLTLQPLADGKSMHVTMEFSEQAKKAMLKSGVSEQSLNERLTNARNQEWRRLDVTGAAAVLRAEVTTPETASGVLSTDSSKLADIAGKWRGEDRWGEITLQLSRETLGVQILFGNYANSSGRTGPITLASSPRTPGRFQGEWGSADYLQGRMSIQLQPDGKTIRGSWTIDGGAEHKPGKPQSSDLEWVRASSTAETTTPVKPAADDIGSQDSVGRKYQIESDGILIEEAQDELKLYSKPLGKWTTLKLSRRADGGGLLSETHVSAELAVISHGNLVYGFSSRTGRLAKLTIPNDYRGPVIPEMRAQYAVIQLGEDTYVLTARAGEWSSPNSATSVSDKEPQNKSNRTATRQEQPRPISPAARQLVEQLGAQESAADAEAATILQLQAGGQADRNQQSIAEHQRRLKSLLSTAFDLKLQVEEVQLRELQTRISRLERQIGQRKELREKIISRRASELNEGDVLRWDLTAGAPAKVLEPSSEAAEKSSASAPTATAKADHIEIDLYGGAKVLPGLSKNPRYSKLIQSLNALQGVTTNFRVVQVADATIIVSAIVRDPSQRCLRETLRTQKESELKIAINSALQEAGVAIRWHESSEATASDDPDSTPSGAAPRSSRRPSVVDQDDPAAEASSSSPP